MGPSNRAYSSHSPTYREATISTSPTTGLPKEYSPETVPLIGSPASSQSRSVSTVTSYLGRTYSSTRTSSCVFWSAARAVSFQTPRFGSVDSGRSTVTIP